MGDRDIGEERSSQAGKEIKYESYRKWPENPTLSDYFTFIPLHIAHYFANLSNAFGWKFVTFVASVYGIQQGMDSEFIFAPSCLILWRVGFQLVLFLQSVLLQRCLRSRTGKSPNLCCCHNDPLEYQGIVLLLSPLAP
jgi:hypothetical protein